MIGPTRNHGEARRNLDHFRRARIRQQAAPCVDCAIRCADQHLLCRTCGLTTQPDTERYVRPAIVPSVANGVERLLHVMTETLAAVPRSKLGTRIGALTADDMDRVEQAMLLVLGIAR